MKKIKILTCIFLSIAICLFTFINVFAQSDEKKVVVGNNQLEVKEYRTVFTTDGRELVDLPYYYMTMPSRNITNVPYFLIALPIESTAPVGSNIVIKGEKSKYMTIEQKDNYSGINVYYTVWENSKKLRILGHDEQLTYPAIICDDVYNSDCGQYANTPVALISVDDFKKIYGYDQNFWAEKNTMYFKRNGQGLLQKYKNYNPSASTKKYANTTVTSKKGNYTTYSGFSYIPDYTAITGEKVLDVKPIKTDKYIGYQYTYPFNNQARRKYESFVQQVGGFSFRSDTEYETCTVTTGFGYGLYPSPSAPENLRIVITAIKYTN